MSSYIDIHSHILPQIDDGAENFEMCMKMLRIAHENEINKIILTPHNKPTHHSAGPGRIMRQINELQEEIEKQGLAITLYAGNEIYYRSDILTLLEEKGACTMAGSDYVLVEYNPMDDFSCIRKGIYQLLSGGYFPILAHAERYSALYASTDRVKELIDLGCYIQVNAGSIMGQYGFGIKKCSRRLLKQELVHFVATDAHDDVSRTPCLLGCTKYIRKKYGDERVERIFVENPSHIIANEYIRRR